MKTEVTPQPILLRNPLSAANLSAENVLMTLGFSLPRPRTASLPRMRVPWLAGATLVLMWDLEPARRWQVALVPAASSFPAHPRPSLKTPHSLETQTSPRRLPEGSRSLSTAVTPAQRWVPSAPQRPQVSDRSHSARHRAFD